MNRRYFLESCATFGVIAAMSQSLLGCVIAQNKGGTRVDDAAPKKIMKSDEEWKRILSPEQYYITRQAGTEEPYSSSLLNVHESGTFECICCDLPLFSSKTKFDSHTGWPSFWAPIAKRNVPLLHERSGLEVLVSMIGSQPRTPLPCQRIDTDDGLKRALSGLGQDRAARD